MSTDSPLRTTLAEWKDCDISEHALAQALGIFPADMPMRDQKWVYWTNNPLGSRLHSMLNELVQLGILEKRDEPDEQYRWCEHFRPAPGRPAED